jgi:hypothetical protein
MTGYRRVRRTVNRRRMEKCQVRNRLGRMATQPKDQFRATRHQRDAAMARFTTRECNLAKSNGVGS